MLGRHGWTCQVPARRAIERDEAAVAGWVKETWPHVEGPWRRSAPGPAAATPPLVRVRGRTRRRLSVAALVCYKPRERSRLICRPCPGKRADARKSFSREGPPRSDPDRPRPARRPHRAGPGQPQHPPHGRDASVYR
ncbi:winged helix-turn-helix domain-containing protein [Streptomyces sp. 3N207]|uniref:winged helix-turn-helix domain-containing protein n=1 Tax=Streptomyces sp. 3N207 TaxID=3457417 RepID=UPI003FD6633F